MFKGGRYTIPWRVCLPKRQESRLPGSLKAPFPSADEEPQLDMPQKVTSGQEQSSATAAFKKEDEKRLRRSQEGKERGFEPYHLNRTNINAGDCGEGGVSASSLKAPFPSTDKEERLDMSRARIEELGRRCKKTKSGDPMKLGRSSPDLPTRSTPLEVNGT
ncbi:hypothetical protein BDK51DRAFT_31754 [Blyttiomyces helicus]|uniref:Uncharacterized protein n=1 Tax=Blyttiomyces helicus TaxID=388810 RepID=A0A4V1IQH1_9FUNG|nr:hypothetical protein BDK51DRAFT_31754 [Blyttiomyces helicus]|eukprot:RKO86537.1 hypothetical protein BDK51DRAFT_31754 [Blyttiomyces helicus]